MKLCAIYNVWDDWDLLHYSVKNIYPLVDGVIVVASTKSNYGEVSEIPERVKWTNLSGLNISLYVREPQFTHPMNSETDKRNYGLQVAKNEGYTHFLTCDSDEFYNPQEFMKAKERFNLEPELDGLVCQLQCYFKRPTLTIGIESTRVPFIHKLTPTIKHEFNRHYPFAWEGRDIRIDPTRSLNINSGVQFTTEVTMHHMSHIRKDYAKKIRNSTAKANIERSTILEDLENAKPGYFCKFYQKTLHEVPDYFNLEGKI